MPPSSARPLDRPGARGDVIAWCLRGHGVPFSGRRPAVARSVEAQLPDRTQDSRLRGAVRPPAFEDRANAARVAARASADFALFLR